MLEIIWSNLKLTYFSHSSIDIRLFGLVTGLTEEYRFALLKFWVLFNVFSFFNLLQEVFLFLGQWQFFRSFILKALLKGFSFRLGWCLCSLLFPIRKFWIISSIFLFMLVAWKPRRNYSISLTLERNYARAMKLGWTFTTRWFWLYTHWFSKLRRTWWAIINLFRVFKANSVLSSINRLIPLLLKYVVRHFV